MKRSAGGPQVGQGLGVALPLLRELGLMCEVDMSLHQNRPGVPYPAPNRHPTDCQLAIVAFSNTPATLLHYSTEGWGGGVWPIYGELKISDELDAVLANVLIALQLSLRVAGPYPDGRVLVYSPDFSLRDYVRGAIRLDGGDESLLGALWGIEDDRITRLCQIYLCDEYFGTRADRGLMRLAMPPFTSETIDIDGEQMRVCGTRTLECATFSYRSQLNSYRCLDAVLEHVKHRYGVGGDEDDE